ncbi:prepilin-type N-terminal cleavage/methylation domain-containing protein [Candidatus Saganbacteria bacterium]|nr:prepilin-type N-terminal cleavage/methylation domain-containing protein [Candidatus Saganbacteria bacterium]
MIETIKLKSPSRGFTLVELLISLTVLIIFLGSLFYAVTVELRQWRQLADISQQQQTRQIILSRIVKEIRAAKEISATSSSTNLNLVLPAGHAEFRLQDGKIRCQVNSYVAFLSDNDEIKTFRVSYPGRRQVELYLDKEETLVGLRN